MSVAVVVPCFNEASRVVPEAFERLASAVDHLVLVDDGSTDATAEALDTIAIARPAGTVEVVRLERNRGKAEAVRTGLLRASGAGSIVGYFDADFATPVSELERLVRVIVDHPELDAVLASRVALLGHSIERNAVRHYLGRMYATAASLALDIPVYDTQCGAKLFRTGPTLAAALAIPFPDRWSFDVELLARLLYPAAGFEPLRRDQIAEVPLREWRDVGGSKLRATSAVRSLVALAAVRRRIRSRQRVSA
jgi:glycosyltransferase involved in cell wall biosynthesis